MSAFRRDPFSLMAFHRVLIAVAFLFAIGYGIWEVTRNRTQPGSLLRASIAWGAAAGFAVYLWRIRGRR
jgi:hypothetical protein